MTNYNAELIESEHSEADEWGFRADIRVRLHNPNGDDVIAVRTYKARPKAEGLTNADEQVHEYTAYWWLESYPEDGDRPFMTTSVTWRPAVELDDDEALFDECIEAATTDAKAEIDSLAATTNRHREQLERHS